MSLENKIPNGWVETTLGEVITTNDNSIGRNFQYTELEYLDTGSITVNNIENYQTFKIIDAPSRAKRLVQDGDIVYSTVRPNQKHYGFIINPKENLVVSTGFAVIRTKQNSCSKFIYYWLTQNSVTLYLQQLAEQSTSTYPAIKPIDIENLSFEIPKNIEEQVAIAKTLTAFDDKIENLQAQNNTLETTAQTIFKEWFGKYQIGDELPEGWRVGNLSDISKHIKVNIKPFNNPNKDYYHYSLPGYDNGLMPSLDKGNTIKSNKYSVTDNSFLVSKLNPFTPRIWTIFNSEESAICSTEFQVLKPQKQCFFSLIHCILNSKYFTSELSQKLQGTSSSHQRVKPQDIFNVRIIIPNNNTLSDFDLLVSPLILKKSINHSQIETLKKTRDTLLPKLMKGELRVKI